MKKKLEEMTLKDNFMFSAVMMNPKNCKPMLERILGIDIGRVTVDREKSIVYNPDYKGVRLDVMAKDQNNTHYNVEMQVTCESALPLRSRYYHSQMDMELLERGLPYSKLPPCIVIFVCDFDPFGKNLCYYTIEHLCRETNENFGDRTCTILLNTCGKNREEISPELLSFLDFVHAKLSDSQKDNPDAYIRQLQKSIQKIKHSREMGARYMLLTEMMEKEFRSGFSKGQKSGFSKGEKSGFTKGEQTGKASVLLQILKEKGTVSSQIQERLAQADPVTMDSWIQPAITAADPEDFLKKITK